MRHYAFIAIVTLAATPALAVDDTPQLPTQFTALQACRGKTDAAERLSCYDRAVDALSAATSSRELVVIDRREVRKARKGLFGFTLPKIPFLIGREGDPDDAAEARALETTVVSARRWNRAYWRFTVEGGAVWETVEEKRGFTDPKAGSPVTIERGTLGAYYAKVGRGGRVLVKRVQ